MTVLSVEGVAKSFRIPEVHRETVRDHALALFRPRRFRELPVLRDVSFKVHAGETLAILGRNGCGKSTLLKILTGIYRPDRGHVHIHAPLTPILELGLGWNPELDAVDNVYLIGAVMGLTLSEIRAAMDEILAFADVAPFANLKLQHYSTGMAARLAYSVAFHAVRDVLILDEIFAVGDAAFRLRCEARYRELAAAGHTVLLVSHDRRIVTSFCDRAILIDGGTVVGDDAPDRIWDEYFRVATTPASPGGAG